MHTPRVKLTRFRIKAFRSCKNTELALNSKSLTVLIGLNGSGKTNLLHALRLLSASEGRYSRHMAKRYPLALKCKVEADFSVGNVIVYYRSVIRFQQTQRNTDDVFKIEERYNFKNLPGEKDEWIELPPLWEGERFYIMRRGTNKTGPFRLRLVDPGPKQPSRTIVKVVKAISDFRSKIKYYSSTEFGNPSLCPVSFEIDEDGDIREPMHEKTRAKFLYDLYKISQTKISLYQHFLNLVNEKGLNLIHGSINWNLTEYETTSLEAKVGGRVVNETRKRGMIVPTVNVKDSQLSFNQLSEGTFRTLAIIFYAITDNSKLLLIEEPEVNIHHGLLNDIVEILKIYAAKDKQIVLSTHSEALIDRVKPEEVVLISNAASKGTIAKRISKSMSSKQYEALKKYLETSGNLGEYWREGGF